MKKATFFTTRFTRTIKEQKCTWCGKIIPAKQEQKTRNDVWKIFDKVENNYFCWDCWILLNTQPFFNRELKPKHVQQWLMLCVYPTYCSRYFSKYPALERLVILKDLQKVYKSFFSKIAYMFSPKKYNFTREDFDKFWEIRSPLENKYFTSLPNFDDVKW